MVRLRVVHAVLYRNQWPEFAQDRLVCTGAARAAFASRRAHGGVCPQTSTQCPSRPPSWAALTCHCRTASLAPHIPLAIVGARRARVRPAEGWLPSHGRVPRARASKPPASIVRGSSGSAGQFVSIPPPHHHVTLRGRARRTLGATAVQKVGPAYSRRTQASYAAGASPWMTASASAPSRRRVALAHWATCANKRVPGALSMGACPLAARVPQIPAWRKHEQRLLGVLVCCSAR